MMRGDFQGEEVLEEERQGAQSSSLIVFGFPFFFTVEDNFDGNAEPRRRGSEGEGGIYATVGRRAGRRRPDGEVAPSPTSPTSLTSPTSPTSPISPTSPPLKLPTP